MMSEEIIKVIARIAKVDVSMFLPYQIRLWHEDNWCNVHNNGTVKAG